MCMRKQIHAIVSIKENTHTQIDDATVRRFGTGANARALASRSQHQP